MVCYFGSLRSMNSCVLNALRVFQKNYCREILQEYTGLSFPSIRPNWLKNSVSGYNLELDGFCEDL